MTSINRIIQSIESAVEHGKANQAIVTEKHTMSTKTTIRQFTEADYRKAIMNCYHRHMNNKQKETNNVH